MARQPFTLLWESSTEGVEGLPPLLLAGTAQRLYRHTPDGSWVYLHQHQYCDDGDLFSARYGVAQLAGLFAVIHTRGGIWDLTTGVQPEVVPGMYSYLKPNDTAIALDIQAAQIVHQSHGFFFFADLTISGVRERGLVHWSDFETTNLIPGGESRAGFFSFGGDAIVAVQDLGNATVFYTDRGIWLATFVGGDISWSFERIYTGPDVPRYPRTLVDIGDAHVYLSSNTIFTLLRGERTPRVYDWLDKASGIIFNPARPELTEGLPDGLLSLPEGLAPQDCHVPCGWYNDNERHIWFSWKDKDPDADLPNWSIVLSAQHRTACLVDHGFTAGAMTKQPPPGTTESFNRHLWRFMGCTPHPLLNEHSIVNGPGPVAPPLNLYNETEDPDLPPSEDSYCSLLQAQGICFTICPSCLGDNRLIMTSAEDFSIKEWSWDFGLREQLDNPEDMVIHEDWNNTPLEDRPWLAEGPNPVWPGEYRNDNFLTLFQSDALLRGKESYAWALHTIETGLARIDTPDELAESYLFPWNFFGQGGAGDSARCISWTTVDQDEFGCPEDEEANLPSYLLGAANPIVHPEAEGRYVSFRLYIGDAPGGTNRAGPVSFTGMTLDTSRSTCR